MVPIARLGEFQALDEGRIDELIDAVDEFSQGGDFPLFIDHQFKHPGFPNDLVYSWANPVVRYALRDAMEFSDHRTEASRLVHFLTGRVLE